MKLPRGTPLAVDLGWTPSSAPTPAARLAMDAGLAMLEWSPEVIGAGLKVAGLDQYYPPETGLHAARGREFGGLNGFLTDSLPDGWGYLLMRRRLAKAGVDIASLTPLERLALVGDQGRGALTFRPATAPKDAIETLDLDLLAEAAVTLAGEAPLLADTLAGLAGGSGGARPKVHVSFNAQGDISVGAGETPEGYEAWIVKFPAREDPEDIGPIEGAYADMAAAAGVRMSPHRLIPARRGPAYFATRRFDRTEDGGRRHMVSLAGAIEAPSDRPSTSYDLYMRATRAITRRSNDVTEMFRRMLFNLLASNRDDHTRQLAFLMDPAGDWTLAPAFDLTYAPGPGGEHYMDIEGEGRRPTRGHVRALGARHGLKTSTIDTLLEEVQAAIARWPELAAEAGVGSASLQMIAEAHQRVQSDFEA